jgi:hypothetical protein
MKVLPSAHPLSCWPVVVLHWKNLSGRWMSSCVVSAEVGVEQGGCGSPLQWNFPLTISLGVNPVSFARDKIIFFT